MEKLYVIIVNLTLIFFSEKKFDNKYLSKG